MIEPRMDILKPICEKYECEFSCAMFIYAGNESTPSMRLDLRYNQIIKTLNIEFDLDLYCFSDNEIA